MATTVSWQYPGRRRRDRLAQSVLPLVYDELRKLAAAKLAHEKPGQTLQATALVHEAYLRLVGGSQENWNSLAAAAEAMRRILIGQARRKASLKAGPAAARGAGRRGGRRFRGRVWICSPCTRPSSSPWR
jgi:hypothetical protein